MLACAVSVLGRQYIFTDGFQSHLNVKIQILVLIFLSNLLTDHCIKKTAFFPNRFIWFTFFQMKFYLRNVVKNHNLNWVKNVFINAMWHIFLCAYCERYEAHFRRRHQLRSSTNRVWRERKSIRFSSSRKLIGANWLNTFLSVHFSFFFSSFFGRN